MDPPVPAHRDAARRGAGVALVSVALVVAGCAAGRPPPPAATTASGGRTPAYNRPYQVRGRTYAPHAQPGYDAVGVASWYSYEAPSRRTADGEPFDIRIASAAHTTLPIPGWLEVTNLDNGRRARVRLNDRGPFVPGRLLDVSRAAAAQLGFLQQGTARVRVRYLGPAGPLDRYAEALPPPPAPRAEVLQDAATRQDDAVRRDDAEGAIAAPPPVDPLDAPRARFAVQVAAFADRDNAERAVARLSGAGRPRIEPVRRGDATLYRVLLGGWPQAQDAAAARSEVAALGFADARVVGR